MKRKYKKIYKHRYTIGYLIFTTVMCFILLFAVHGYQKRLVDRDIKIELLTSELKWREYKKQETIKKAPAFRELQYLTGLMKTRYPEFYQMAKSAYKWGKIYKVNPLLILAIIHRESNFNRMAISIVRGKACAFGPMQINYKVWKDELNLDINRIHDIDYNIEHGVKILKYYIDKNNGNTWEALWEYWGRGNPNTYSPSVLGSPYHEPRK